MDHLPQHIEALIFAAPSPIGLEELTDVLEEAFGLRFATAELEAAIEALKERYADPAHSFEVVEVAGGFQFMSKGAYHQTIGTHLRQSTNKRLSRSALETLSIVAYKQPVTKSELEKIRGVSCDYAIQKLLEKELVTISGRADTVGKPLLYGVTNKFLDYFGIKDLADLPQPKDFQQVENTIGEPERIEETVVAKEEE
ncbi:MAG: SMC-Scp complex subunit ScpB [Bacteroidota bacterium]